MATLVAGSYYLLINKQNGRIRTYYDVTRLTRALYNRIYTDIVKEENIKNKKSSSSSLSPSSSSVTTDESSTSSSVEPQKEVCCCCCDRSKCCCEKEVQKDTVENVLQQKRNRNIVAKHIKEVMRTNNVTTDFECLLNDHSHDCDLLVKEMVDFYGDDKFKLVKTKTYYMLNNETNETKPSY